jgi:hypothetical protein
VVDPGVAGEAVDPSAILGVVNPDETYDYARER